MTDKERKLLEQSGLLFPADAAPAPRPPIEMIIETISEKVSEETEGLVFRAVQDARVKVNREELIRALELDKMVREGKLIEPIRCEQCQHSRKCITGAYRCRLWMITRMADDFCSEAKRRREKTDEL